MKKIFFFCVYQQKNEGQDKIHDVHGLTKGIEDIQLQNNKLYENMDAINRNDSDHSFRTEMNLVLSYNGNKSKYTTQNKQELDKTQDSDIDTPPPNFPQAMKLFPNKLAYTVKNGIVKTDSEATSTKSEYHSKDNVDSENNTNEKLLSKSHVKIAVDASGNKDENLIGKKLERINETNDEHEHEHSTNQTSNTDDTFTEQCETVSFDSIFFIHLTIQFNLFLFFVFVFVFA